MMIEYLLDTNIFSNLMRPIPNDQLLQKLELNKNKISTATIVIHELLFGCWRLPESKKRYYFEEYINNLILTIPVLDYDLKSAKYHAKERVRLSKIGKTPAFIDGQIASIAVSNNLRLVTNNIDDFKDFEGLIMEAWIE